MILLHLQRNRILAGAGATHDERTPINSICDDRVSGYTFSKMVWREAAMLRTRLWSLHPLRVRHARSGTLPELRTA